MTTRRRVSRPHTGTPFRLSSRLLCDSSNAKEQPRELFAVFPLSAAAQPPLLDEFRVVLGTQPRQGKEWQGDGRTPVGRYYVADKNRESRFHRFLGISYPNVEDAERGYRSGRLDAGAWADIFLANLRGEAPPWHTALGGRVGIHGYGGRPYLPVDWTEGCVAVSDQEIEFIYERAPLGTPVIINE